MTFAQLSADLKAGKFKPVYLLQGAEPFFIDELSAWFEKYALPEAEKGFNQTVLYGKDTDMISVLNAAKRYPMMAERQLVLVKEAQELKWAKGENDGKTLDPLTAYLENPLPSTVLVFAHKYKSLDKRLKTTKLIEKNGLIFDSARLYDNKVPAWIIETVKSFKRKIQPEAADLLLEYLGADLGRIHNEIEKLLLNLKESEEITPDIIRKNIGISKEYNVFELTDAIAKKDLLKAYRIIDYFAANPKAMPQPLLFGNLNTYFSRLLRYYYLPDRSPEAVKKSLGLNFFSAPVFFDGQRNYSHGKLFDVFALLREYDLKFKGVGATNSTPQNDLMKELLFKLMH
ncbi:MAG: DNA polymerase III subunit delta [Mucilaginibacter polytrichastri]|nr:DNA polymerase III subunit delta [Mucilaginibacter polytrichastri]